MMDRPAYCTWDGDAFVPLSRFKRLADQQFVVGEVYPLVVHEERSQSSHGHFFACLHDAWANLPDDIAMEFPTADSLRKRALIEAGYYDERRLITSSPAEARKMAAFLKPVDDFALISVAGNVVIERKAKSQSIRAMGKREFQESKTKVLGVLADMLGVTPEDLASQSAVKPPQGERRAVNINTASGDAAGPAEAPARGQAHTDTPPLVPGSQGDGVGTDAGEPARTPASVPLDVYGRFSAALFEVASGGPRALAGRRLRFRDEQGAPAEKARVEAIYAAHLERVTGEIDRDECSRRCALEIFEAVA